MKNGFKWVVEITVDPTWVEDGFNLTEDRAKDMIEKELPHSYSHETAVRVLAKPDGDRILKQQGYRPSKMTAKEKAKALRED